MGRVLLLALFLFLATFGIGWLPSYYVGKGLAHREKYIAMLSQFGVGMLLGTSFMLVIPEGVAACTEHGGNVGLNMLIGCLVVYILDRVVQILMSGRGGYSSIPNDESSELESVKDVSKSPKRMIMAILKNNVVFALVIHGLSDGIVLGTTANNESLLIVVLIAIIIHKIPAVLSLTSLMISKQRLPKGEVLSNLFAFALSTPLGYVIVSALNLRYSEAMDWIGGNVLLMSGGSLLYASFTAFTSADCHDHIPMEERAEGGLLRDSRNAVMADGLCNNATSEDGAASTNKSNDLTADFPNITVVSSAPQPDRSDFKLRPSQELIYVLLGVTVPTIISFFIS